MTKSFEDIANNIAKKQNPLINQTDLTKIINFFLFFVGFVILIYIVYLVNDNSDYETVNSLSMPDIKNSSFLEFINNPQNSIKSM